MYRGFGPLQFRLSSLGLGCVASRRPAAVGWGFRVYVSGDVCLTAKEDWDLVLRIKNLGLGFRK